MAAKKTAAKKTTATAAKKSSSKKASASAAASKELTPAQLRRKVNEQIAARAKREQAQLRAFERVSPRVLNTVTALQAKGKQPQMTAYAGTRVLVARSTVTQELIVELTEVANSMG